MSEGKTAVVLLQLGGPDSTDAVEPFLYNLFCDPDIIDFPGAFLARRPLAKLISSRRSKRVRQNYEQIGGKSPILDLTTAQAEALASVLRRDMDAGVHIAMRYWKPFTADAVEAVRMSGADHVVLLPLYPHYSKATTLSSVREWRRQCARAGFTPRRVDTVCCFYNHPLYVGALAERVREGLARFRGGDPAEIDIVFSAHGVPVSLIEGGDPYRIQIEETVRLVVEKVGRNSPHTLCYQSKVGPAEWLKPGLTDTVARLAAGGRRKLLIVPVSFVTDHIETLHEIDIETRQEAAHLGVEQFELAPAINSSPAFIACLAELVTKTVRGETFGTETCRGTCHRHPPATEPALCPHWGEPGLTAR